jgi:hypothetical protein
MRITNIIAVVTLAFTFACTNSTKKPAQSSTEDTAPAYEMYKSVKLTTDTDALSLEEKAVITEMIAAADIMNRLFWVQSFGNQDSFLSGIEDLNKRNFAEINYGPWDRLNDNKPFLEGYEDKPKGANIYPHDITTEELESLGDMKMDLYSMVRRDRSGKLYTIPYHEFFRDELLEASEHLKAAAELTRDPSLKLYLNLRAQALLDDEYDSSDIAWLNMKANKLDIIIGPIENYEDKLLSARTAYEAYVLVKDMDWSKRLEKYVAFLPELQSNLPVDEAYRKELPGSSSQLNAYDVIYYAGDCNAGSKTIAVNLPNDAAIQTAYGTRRSQLKNAMKAKFDEILVPLSKELIAQDQQQHITFDAFFANTMFHEVAHGLGVKKTLDGRPIRDALLETSSALEEGKADVLGLFMITYLRDKGVVTEGELMDNYVTFMASIFRSIRFGSASAHGQANLIRFNYFKEVGAFSRDETTGKYTVHPEKMAEAVNGLSALILKLQGDGDKAGVDQLLKDKAVQGEILTSDLERLKTLGIPVDIVFEQGLDVLGL